MGRVMSWFLLVCVLGACSFDLAGPGEGEGTLEFGARAAGHGQWLEQPLVQAEGGSGRIVVNTKLSTPDPCRTLSGQLEGAGAELIVRVTIAPDGSPGCYQIIGTFEYDAVIRDLAPSNYRLRVVHTYTGNGWPTVTAFDGTVRVR